MTADGKRPEERLTGKQRMLRGLKYSLGVFAVVSVLAAASVTVAPERDVWSWRAAFAAVCGAPAAVLAGVDCHGVPPAPPLARDFRRRGRLGCEWVVLVKFLESERKF